MITRHVLATIRIRTFPAAFALAAIILTLFTNPAMARNTLATGDFDGDGRADLAIGIPGEDMQTIVNAGGIQIIYGSGTGLTILADEYRHQDKPNVNDQCETDDLFGYAVAAGDFDNDGFDDLAVGIPYENIGAVADAGAIAVFYGGPNGVLDQADQFWHQDSPGMVDSAQGTDQFGDALVAADFNDDGFHDLAIGVPREDILTDTEGAVHIMYGSGSGLTPTGNQLWHQNSPGIAETPQSIDGFGDALAAGDFDNDGFDDLAVGVPFEEIDGQFSAGAVQIIYGSGSGLTAASDQLWHQNSTGVAGQAEPNDNFGHALAAGDFNNDGFDDLAIGVPYQDVLIGDAGAVHVLYGSPSGLASAGSQFWHQDKPGILGDPNGAGHFAFSLAAGDFDGDSFDDLALGIPHLDVSSTDSGGAVHILYGSASKLKAAGNQVWHQDTPGIKNVAETLDQFGTSLIAGDFNNDGRADLAVSVPAESIDAVSDAGAVAVLYGKSAGLAAAGNQLWHQNIPDAHDTCETDDFYAGIPPGF